MSSVSGPDLPGDDPVPVGGQLAEVAVLGACMWSAEAARGAVAHLAPDLFQREAHRVIFEAVSKLIADDDPVDTVSVTVRLMDDGRLDNGATAVDVYDVSTLECCPTPSAWPRYAAIVRREHDRRETVRALRRAIDRLEAGEDPATVRAGLAVAS